MKNLSPENYIKERVPDLPYFESLVSSNYKDPATKKLLTVALSKKQPSGKICVGLFLIDKLCMGLKNTSYRLNLDEDAYKEFMSNVAESIQDDIYKTDLSFIHNLVFGAIDYAEELGFKPHKDFNITKYFLDEDLITEGIDEIEFGSGGKPLFIPGPNDDVQRVLGILNRTAGKGNFEVIMPGQPQGKN